MGRYLGVLVLLTIFLVTASAASNVHDRVTRSVKGEADFTTKEECEGYYGIKDHTMCLPKVPKAEAKLLSEAEKTFLLDKHNYLRCGIQPTATDMLQMYWNKYLEVTAQKWAEQCKVAHDINKKETPEWLNIALGQNMAFGHVRLDVALERWWNESHTQNYVYGATYNSSYGYGHFLQMSFAQTTLIGCGRAYCPDSKYKHHIVCNYLPRIDNRVQLYMSGVPCSACPTKCAEGTNLCDCKGKVCLKGTLNVTDCSCICREYYKGENCDEFDCTRVEKTVCKNFNEVQCDLNDVTYLGTTFDVRINCPYLCGVCDMSQACEGKSDECEQGTLNVYNCKCECDDGYEGEFCDTVECAAHICENGGTAYKDGDECKCECAEGYSGSQCNTQGECKDSKDCYMVYPGCRDSIRPDSCEMPGTKALCQKCCNDCN